MTAPAAPPSGRRASFGAAAVLAGFLLLAPPLYVLGPFALLALLARPRTPRELLWLALSAAGVSATLGATPLLGAQIIRTSGLALTAAFGVLSLRPRGPVFPRAFAALLLATATVTVWYGMRGLSYAGVQEAFAEMLRVSYQAFAGLNGTDPKARQDLQNFVQPFLNSAPQIAAYFPGLLALEALGGVLLAWDWHHRIASRPLGIAPRPFREFRFNDHLVWGAIFTLGLVLAPLPAPATAVFTNVLMVWAGLYVLRGLAIIATLLAPAPAPIKVLAVGLAFLLIPVVLGACLALGLADTWLDIRGRIAPPAPGGA